MLIVSSADADQIFAMLTDTGKICVGVIGLQKANEASKNLVDSGTAEAFLCEKSLIFIGIFGIKKQFSFDSEILVVNLKSPILFCGLLIQLLHTNYAWTQTQISNSYARENSNEQPK